MGLLLLLREMLPSIYGKWVHPLVSCHEGTRESSQNTNRLPGFPHRGFVTL